MLCKPTKPCLREQECLKKYVVGFKVSDVEKSQLVRKDQDISFRLICQTLSGWKHS